MNIGDSKKINIRFEWIFWIFIKWLISWTNIWFILPASKLFVAKCLKLIWNHSGIISGTDFSDQILALFWNFDLFSSIFWMSNSVEYFGLC